MTTDLIPVFPVAIGNSTVNAVDARKLHEFLEVRSEFRNWIKNRIADYGFVQNIDYIAGNFLPGSDRIDYHCSISMGKELAMVERNAKGKQARQYFIECERRLMDSKPTLPDFSNPADAARAWALEYERAETEKRDKLDAYRQIEAAQPKIAFHDQVTASETLLDFTEMFSLLQRKTGQRFTRASFLAFARRHAIACQANPHNGVTQNRFVPRKDYVGTWFVSELHGNGVAEWKVRPMAIAGIVALIEIDRSRYPFQANDDQDDREAA